VNSYDSPYSPAGELCAVAPLHGEERDRLYARQAQLVPAYAEYQTKTSRPIPVVWDERSSSPARWSWPPGWL
jgi:hypothetical protein